MQTRTSFPLPPHIEAICINGTYYCIETQADYAAATGVLRTFLDNRTAALASRAATEALENAVEQQVQAMDERLRKRLRAQNGVPVVSAHAIMRAARAANRLAQIETWIANNKATNDLALKLAYGAENITQAELVAVDPTQGAAVFSAALAL